MMTVGEWYLIAVVLEGQAQVARKAGEIANAEQFEDVAAKAYYRASAAKQGRIVP